MCGEHFERRVLTVKCTEPMCCRVSWPQCSPSWSRGGFQLFERLCSALRAGVLRRSSSTTPRITGAVCVVSRLFLIQGTFGCPATESREHQGQAYSFPFPPDKNSSHSWSFGYHQPHINLYQPHISLYQPVSAACQPHVSRMSACISLISAAYQPVSTCIGTPPKMVGLWLGRTETHPYQGPKSAVWVYLLDSLKLRSLVTQQSS